MRVDDAELDRAMASIAAQNQISVQQLRERLAREGTDYARFRADIRDQILIERVREREVQSRIRVSDEEIDAWLAQQRGPAAAAAAEYDIAQILVTVPENAADTVVAERRSRAEAALARVRGGEPFEAVAREMSEDANREQGGSIGLRPADRLPDVFLEAVRNLKPGDVSPTLLKTGAGFHVLKLVERREGAAARVTQTRVRHILLRAAPPVTAEAAARRLAELKQQITTGGRRFEDLAREHSEDGSAPQGGDLGWANAGSLVPEFEQAMNQLPPGGISDPVALALRRPPDPGTRAPPGRARPEAVARAGPRRAARAQVPAGVRRLGARAALPRIHRDARTPWVKRPTPEAARAAPPSRGRHWRTGGAAGWPTPEAAHAAPPSRGRHWRTGGAGSAVSA